MSHSHAAQGAPRHKSHFGSQTALMQWPVGVRPTALRKRWFQALQQMPTGLELPELARRLGEQYERVGRWATFFRYPFTDRRKTRRMAVDCTNVDWEQRDAVIARKVGVSREWVRQLRKANGAGPCAAGRPLHQFKEFIKSEGSRLQTLTVSQIAKESRAQISVATARRVLKCAGISWARPSSRWSHLDWRLPNRELAAIWGLREVRMSNIRSRLKVGSARWELRRGLSITDPAYDAALAQEQRKVLAPKKCGTVTAEVKDTMSAP